MQRRDFLCACAASASALVLPGMARAADTWPSKPIRILVGYGVGGTADISLRIIAPKIAQMLGQSIIIDNKPGAGGIAASQQALALPADGYTLLLAASGNFGITPVLMKSLPFDAVKSFDMVAQIAEFGYAFSVRHDSPFKHVSDIIMYARANPGKLSIATVQVGSAQYFAAELFKSMANIKTVTVPYREAGDVLTSVISGDVQVIVETLSPVVPLVHGGKLRVLGVTEDTAFPTLPDVLPISQQGLPGYVVKGWNGLAARAGTPTDVIEKLNAVIAQVMQQDDVKKRFLDLGIIAKYGKPQVERQLQLADIKTWGDVMQASHMEKQ